MIFFISLWTKTASISFVPQNTCVHSEAQCTCAEIKLISLGDCPYLGNVESNQCIYSWLEMDPEKLLFHVTHSLLNLFSRTVMFKEMQPSSFAFAFAQKVLARLLKLSKMWFYRYREIVNGDDDKFWFKKTMESCVRNIYRHWTMVTRQIAVEGSKKTHSLSTVVNTNYSVSWR